MRGSEAVGSGVAAADDDDVFTRGADRRRPVALALLVGGYEVFHREVHSVELTAGHTIVARLHRTDREHDGVVPAAQFVDGEVDTDVAVDDELCSLSAHLGNTTLDVRLLQLVLGNAVTQEATDAVVLLVDCDVVARSGQLLCCRQSAGTGADDGNRLARLRIRRLGADDALCPRLVGDRLLDTFDRHAAAGRRLGDRQHARRLARCGTDHSGELGEVVGRVQTCACRIPPTTTHEVVPLGNQISQRASGSSGVAERDSAIHTPTGLLGDLVERRDRVESVRVYVFPVLHALGDRTILCFLLPDFQEPAWVSHVPPP